MKKRWLVLVTALMLLVNATGCKDKEQETPDVSVPPVQTPEIPEQKPLRMDALRVEIPRGDISADRLAVAVKELPALMKEYFSDAEAVVIEEVHVTIGSSAAATAQALNEGAVDLAFLPAEAFAEYGTEAVALLGDGAAAEQKKGTCSLLCAGPTQYGAQLTTRVGKGKSLTWKEVDHARWGVLEETSLAGYRCFDLWLADHYAGNCVEDLTQVTMYESYEALFRAAAAEEIDAFVIGEDARELVADAWALSADRTDVGGMRGFDRLKSIWEETCVLAKTETVYTAIAAVADRADLTDVRFSAVLEQMLSRLAEEHPEQMELLGAEQYVPITDEELNPTRRLTTLSH